MSRRVGLSKKSSFGRVTLRYSYYFLIFISGYTTRKFTPVGFLCLSSTHTDNRHMPTLFPADESTIGRNAAYGDTGLLTQSSLSFRLIFTCIQTSFLFSVTRGFRPSLCTTRYYFFSHIDTYTYFTVYTYTVSYNFYVHMVTGFVPYSALCFSPLLTRGRRGRHMIIFRATFFTFAAAFAGDCCYMNHI